VHVQQQARASVGRRERNLLDTANVFAGLLTAMAVGLFVEGIFRTIEHRTVRRWGMQQG